MNKKFKGFYASIIIFVVTLVLGGCNLRIGYISNATSKKMSASFHLLSDTKKKSIKLENGDTITFDYELKEKKGSLTATFEDSSGNVIHSFESNTEGKEEIIIDKDGTYQLIIIGDRAKGSYKFEWTIE